MPHRTPYACRVPYLTANSLPAVRVEVDATDCEGLCGRKPSSRVGSSGGEHGARV